MAITHCILDSSDQYQLEVEELQFASSEKISTHRPSLSISTSYISSSTDSNTSNQSTKSSPTSTPSSPSKPLVFKKPTTHQFHWGELEKMVASKDLKPMARTKDVQESYQRAIRRRTRKYGSPDEYIRQRILYWPPADKDSESSDGNESSSSSSSASPASSPTGPVDPLEVTLKKNEFPYSVRPGIEHWLIWSRNLLTDEDWIRAYLQERLPGRDFLFFINPPELRSVPTIFHIQVFTKGEGEVLDEDDIVTKNEQRNSGSCYNNVI
ncbi:hypothetical protein BGZ76_001502 [Entomortierella beljakovae]|nr:hypothetical protein BGZ76_001502 [Entomortierella beljakovae]